MTMQTHMATFKKGDDGQYHRTDFDPKIGTVHCGVEKVFSMARDKWVWRVWCQQDKPYHRLMQPFNTEPDAETVKARHADMCQQILMG